MDRVFHTWDKWECYPAGFYSTKPPSKDLTIDDCKAMYADFLRDIPRFENAMVGVVATWKNSCEHYLTNERMNRIAWMGQAAMCFATGGVEVFLRWLFPTVRRGTPSCRHCCMARHKPLACAERLS